VARTRRAGATANVRWLDPEEERAWRAIATLIHRLRWALECQLEEDAGLSFIEYHAMARLSEEPDGTLRMSDLAAVTNASLSRLSHLVTRLERWGFVRRRPDPLNGRFTQAILTDAGYRKLAASAPAHVAAVRELVVDAFTSTELGQLRALSGRIVDRVDASRWKQLPT
jgi:DNA-binding MarR family transcriptional regulator